MRVVGRTGLIVTFGWLSWLWGWIKVRSSRITNNDIGGGCCLAMRVVALICIFTPNAPAFQRIFLTPRADTACDEQVNIRDCGIDRLGAHIHSDVYDLQQRNRLSDLTAHLHPDNQCGGLETG